MPQNRSKVNRGLPARWRVLHGAYYYRVPKGLEDRWDGKQLFRLGSKVHEAYKVWSERLNRPEKARTIDQLLDRYALEVIPKKAAASRGSNLNQLPMLRRVFGHRTLLPFPPQLVYEYVDRRGVKKVDPDTGRITGGTVAAHREVELLSHAFTKAVQWGYIDKHPFKGEVRLEGEAARERYVEDWEIIEALSIKSRRRKGSVAMIQAYIRLKLLTGLAQGDLLRLQERDLRDDGIHNLRHKTKAKQVVYTWTPALRDAVALAKASRPVDISPFLFCARDGAGYVDEATGRSSGWKSMWQRFMARVLAETKVETPFTEHDLRAKVGSDADSLAHASELLAHADIRTTKRVYRRKPTKVAPMR